MTSEIIQQACDEINVITQNFDNTRRNLINWQMQVIRGLDNINLMPDVITLAINAIDNSSNVSNYNELSSDLASFIYGSVFMAKAKYETVVNKNKRDAVNLIRNTAEIFINNIQGLLFDVSQGIGNILNTLRNLFFNNENWISSIINFFTSKFQLKEVKESYLNFVEKVLEKISRRPSMMTKSSLYSEIAYDHDSLLMERQTIMLNKKHPDPNIIERSYILFVGLCNFGSFWATIYYIYVHPSPRRPIFFAICSVLLFIHIIFLLKSFKKRKQLKISKIKSYEDWLKKIQLSGNLSNEDLT